MAGMVHGVAHVSYPGGGAFLPARSAEDWQDLISHVMDRVRTAGRVQVLTAGHRWILRRTVEQASIRCTSCGTTSDSGCFDGGLAFCVSCALAAPDDNRQHLEITGWDET
ncbi:hypothetical protein L6Q96_13890 [Candidatus Binatia bacterium]|nr:hypothetical protein [Candidatus Binatia bacterium]